jgi:hypothetical protein
MARAAERSIGAALLHEFNDEQHGAVRAQLIDGKTIQPGHWQRIGLERGDGATHETCKPQTQFEIVVNDET